MAIRSSSGAASPPLTVAVCWTGEATRIARIDCCGRRVIERSALAQHNSPTPKFVLGFLLFSTLASFAVFNKEQITSLANLSRWAFLLTFAGVGLRTNFREIGQQGVRPFVLGAMAEIIIAAATLGLVIGADRVIGL